MSLSARDAYQAIRSTGPELESLLDAAANLRDQFKGRTVTYSRKIFLPITNICRDRCSYCTYRKDPTDPDAWIMSPTEFDDLLLLGAQQGRKEALRCLVD